MALDGAILPFPAARQGIAPSRAEEIDLTVFDKIACQARRLKQVFARLGALADQPPAMDDELVNRVAFRRRQVYDASARIAEDAALRCLLK